MVRRKAANARLGSKAVTQKSEKRRIADFGAGDASASVRFRPKADIQEVDSSRSTPLAFSTVKWLGWVSPVQTSILTDF